MKIHSPVYLLLKGILPGILLFIGTISQANVWKMESSILKFEINNFGSAVEGTFSVMQTIIVFDPSNLPSSSVNVSIEISSIDTGNKTRDKHLKGKDYFDGENYKQIIFKSSQILPGPQKDSYVVKGNLVIKGITREITFPIIFEKNGSNGKFSGTLNLNRLDFKVGSSSWVLGDEVKISFQLNTTKQ